MQGTNYYKGKLSQWKEKAKTRSKEIGSLKKRQLEILASRDNWKEKYKLEKTENKRLQKAISNLENKPLLDSEKPKHHSYTLQVMLLCMMLRQQANCSLRSCASMLKIMSVVLGLKLSFPSRNTIQNWEKKLGYSRIHKKGQKGDKWVVVLDESVSIGQQKLLLILGAELGKYKFGKALNFEDMEVLYLGIGKSWKGDRISEELEKLKSDGFDIVHGVSDGGTNLVKSLKMSKIALVQDCTHVFGNLLKKQYNTNEEFLKFSKECGVLKRGVMLGEDAVVMPPTQRSKARFLNLQPLSEWAYKVLILLAQKESKLTKKQREKLTWLKPYKKLVFEIYEQCQTMNKVSKILKNEGLSKATAQKCKAILAQSKATSFFKEGVEQYLERNLSVLASENPLICSSDIIESFFGKYKNQLEKSGCKLITESCLAIANFNQNFEKEEIKKAMEKVKIVDLKKWRQENLPVSLLQQKRELFKNTG
jgi:hypothetical protein